MTTAACIEIGGGGIQTVTFTADAAPSFSDGAHQADGAALLIAVPGLIDGVRVAAASNLGWFDVDPVEQLGLTGPATVVCNDAEAAALGEAALRGVDELGYVGLGTGVGGVIVRDGVVVEREVLGHRGSFGDAPCSCGRTGCLETVAAGWALPDPLPAARIDGVAVALATAIRQAAMPAVVVISGGLARRYPAIVEGVRALVPEHTVDTSAAPAAAKSASAWGLLRLAGIDLSGRPAPTP